MGHGLDPDDDTVESPRLDPRSAASAGRKSSGASSFLRKTIRFKDKSAFLKARPSISSMTSDSAVSSSLSVPPSPADPPSGSDMDEASRRSPSYRQVSGRRGIQYSDWTSTQLDSATAKSGETSQITRLNGTTEQDAIAPLPAVTERDLEAISEPQRPLSGAATRPESKHEGNRSSTQPRQNGFGAPTPPAIREAVTHSPIARSSSLRNSLSRSKSGRASSSQMLVNGSPSASLLPADAPASPRRRPQSGSATDFSPHIQPRTTSSPAKASVRRPVTAHSGSSPSQSPHSIASPVNRSVQRISRPKTTESGHGYSNSLSSLRDIMMVAHAISEEGAIYNTPEKKDTHRFESDSSPAAASKVGASPSDPKRPPKNPLRKQRPSAASVASTPSVTGDSPASTHTSGVFPGPPMSRPDLRLKSPHARARDSAGPLSASSSSPSFGEYKTPTSDSVPLPPAESQDGGEYPGPRELARPRESHPSNIPSGSPGLSPGFYSGASSPAQSGFASAQQLSRAPSTDSAAGWRPSRHQRAASDATSSLTDLRSATEPDASTPSLHSESSSNTRKKKDGAGSKMFAFARELAHRESGDANAATSSPGTFRLGRSSKSKKGDATVRPVIRRLYDGPLESDAAALASGQAVEASSPHSQYATGVSPGSSVADLAAVTAVGFRSPDGPATPAMAGPLPSSSSIVHSTSSSAVTAKDLTPNSIHLRTPQFGRTGSGAYLGRSPSFAKPSWSIPQEDLSPDHKRIVKRWFVLRELLETERAYASDLAVARDVYLARAKMRVGITTPLSPLSVRSASIFSQLASPEPSTHGRSSLPHLQQRGNTAALSPGAIMAPGKAALPQRTLFRNASADSTAHAAVSSPGSTSQDPSWASLASSNPSNRTSMFTISSQNSQTSDTSQLALGGHPTLAGGFPSHFSVDGVTPSPPAGVTVTPNVLMTTSSPGLSPYFSTPASSSVSTQSGISAASPAGPTEVTTAGMSDGPLSAIDVRIVFAQLEACASFADEMVVILESAVGKICSGTAEEARELLSRGEVTEEKETDRVGQAFLKLMPRIEQVYTAYCSRHEASMSRLQELLSTQPRAAAFLSECTQAARAYTNAWDLSSLLIKPIQRVLKYPLLLAQILASTSSQHPDADSLAAASIEIQKVADNINEVKKRKDLVEQIVSGKASKRSTSQRMQHGATKKLLRRQEKVKNLVLGPSEDIVADDGQYKALVVQFRQLEKAVTTFSRRCTSWSTGVKDAHVAQLRLLEQWCRTYAFDENAASTEAETRLRAFMDLVERTFLSEYWAQLDSEIRTSLTPAVHRIAALFILPQSVIAKRNDREPDYTRYRSEIARSGAKTVDKKLTESATAFMALHTQLLNELPQFNYGIQTLLDLCIESLSRTQASYHLRVHRALIGFWQSFGPEGNTDIAKNNETDEPSMRQISPVKLFWPLHSNVAGFAESLGIVAGVSAPSPSVSMSRDSDFLAVNQLNPASYTHFSPLQSSQGLPDSDFASKVPDASDISQQIESITAAGSEELLDSMSARASPFTTPPLGSRRPSFSPQIQQQQLLGSPAPIGTVPQGGATDRPVPPPLRSTRSGGLIGLLRSVGGNSADSRKNSQSFDAATDSYIDGTESNPPTPVSKDTPPRSNHHKSGTSPDVVAPSLPALSFNSGFFGQSDAVFTSARTNGLGVETDDDHNAEAAVLTPEAHLASAVADPDQQRTLRASKSPRKAASNVSAAVLGTMAAVANSPSAPREAKDGYPFVDYAVGDLFRVSNSDGVHLFGSSEHGITGWVERENFVPLS